MDSPLVVIALGSNLGESPGTIRRAMDSLERLQGGFFLRSRLYQTAPVDCPPGSPDFLNAAVAFHVRAGETLESLLEKTQQIEREFGRKPKLVLNEARPLDLDLIVFGEERRNEGRLVLPHPRAHLRSFVLFPMADVVPELVPPGWAGTVRELAGLMPGEGIRVVEG